MRFILFLLEWQPLGVDAFGTMDLFKKYSYHDVYDGLWTGLIRARDSFHGLWLERFRDFSMQIRRRFRWLNGGRCAYFGSDCLDEHGRFLTIRQYVQHRSVKKYRPHLS